MIRRKRKIQIGRKGIEKKKIKDNEKIKENKERIKKRKELYRQNCKRTIGIGIFVEYSGGARASRNYVIEVGKYKYPLFFTVRGDFLRLWYIFLHSIFILLSDLLPFCLDSATSDPTNLNALWCAVRPG